MCLLIQRIGLSKHFLFVRYKVIHTILANCLELRTEGNCISVFKVVTSHLDIIKGTVNRLSRNLRQSLTFDTVSRFFTVGNKKGQAHNQISHILH